MDFLKSTAGKIISGLVGLAVVAIGISFYRMGAAGRQAVLSAVGRSVLWVLIVALWPWVSFFIIARVGRMRSNAAGAALVVGYTAIEVALLLWMFDWTVRGTMGWGLLIVGALVAALYNLLACDWIAEKLE